MLITVIALLFVVALMITSMLTAITVSIAYRPLYRAAPDAAHQCNGMSFFYSRPC